MNAHCRIGKVKYKNGLTVLPSIPERRAAGVFKEFDRAAEWMRENFKDDLAGFILISFTYDGVFTCNAITRALRPQINDLPAWAAEVLRRDTSERDARRVVSKTLGIE